MDLNGIRRVVKEPLYRIYEKRTMRFLERDKLPTHIGVILDGHRRYARAEGMNDFRSSYGVGAAKFFEFLEWSDEFQIPVVTCWLLSKENLARQSDELDLLCEVLGTLVGSIPQAVADQDIELKFIGSLDLLPPVLTAQAKTAEEAVGTGTRRLNIALGYGGRQEIVDATRDAIASLTEQGVALEDIPDRVSAELLDSHMYAADVPDPELVIRTSGEARLSGFLLWQSAYAEFSFVDVLWPEFRKVDFLRAMRDFTRRERRFGR